MIQSSEARDTTMCEEHVYTQTSNVISIFLYLASLVVVFIGISIDANVSSFGGPLIEFPLLILAGMLLFMNEGFQVGVIAVRYFENLPDHAKQIKHLIFSPNGEYDKLPRLFLGQSFVVVTTTFLISRITIFNEFKSNDPFLNTIFKSGICGIIITVCTFQLFPSTYASLKPSLFLERVPGIYHAMRAALAIESTGILHFTFVLVGIFEYFWGLQQFDHGSGAFGSQVSKFNSIPTGGTPRSNISSTESNPTMNILITNDMGELEHALEDAVDEKIHWSEEQHRQIELKRHENDTIEKQAWISTEAINRSSKDGGKSIDKLSNDTMMTLESEMSVSLWNACDPFSFCRSGQDCHPTKDCRWNTKVIVSSLVTLTCFIFMMVSICLNRSITKLHPVVILFLLTLLYVMVFYCEGLKIAIVSTAHLDRNECIDKGFDVAIYDLLRANGREDGVQRFLLGRQQIVVPSNFAISALLSFTGYENLDPFSYFLFVGLALPCVLVTLQTVQLTPQVLAGRHPAKWLTLPGAYYVTYAALQLEKLKIANAAYLMTELLVAFVDGREDNEKGTGLVVDQGVTV